MVNVQPKVTLRQQARRILSGGRFILFMVVVTIFALFGDDVRYLVPVVNEAAAFQKVDDSFDVVTVICVLFYVAEIYMQCLADYSQEEKDGTEDKSIFSSQYLWSFYFWLDVFSTSSMLLDISRLTDAIIEAD